jgi:uncharacterized membrane protein
VTTITPTNQELQTLEALRAHRRAHREVLSTQISAHVEPIKPQLTTGQKTSDVIAKTVGSWKFIIMQSVCIIVWIIYNSINHDSTWDPYPFILLNLMLSFQAAYTAPAIMMSQNRQEEKDRERAEWDLKINEKAEVEIREISKKLNTLMTQHQGLADKIDDVLKNEKSED